MPKQYKDHRNSVNITKGYPGTYKVSAYHKTTNPTYSYCLNGKSEPLDKPHFTTGSTFKGEGVFTGFHITVYFNGSNAKIWYDWDGMSGVNRRPIPDFENVPPSRQQAALAQLENDYQNLDQMADEFWKLLNE